MGAATLLNVIRLVIHAHFEPYNDSNDNLFEYLTLIITSLTGVGGLLLQGLETSKEYAMSRSDDVGKQAAEDQIKGVNMFLDFGVYCIIIVFSLFFANIMVGQNNKVRKICARLRHLCARPEDAEEGDGSSTEMTMLSNPSFLVASRDGGGGGDENEEGVTAVAASRAAGGYSEGKADTSSNAVGTTTGESKGSDGDEAARGGGTKKYGSNSNEGARRTRATENPSVANAVLERCVSLRSIHDVSVVGDGTPERESFAATDANLPAAGITARNQEFFQQRRKEKERADAEAAQEKHAARSRLSPEARQEAEEAENAVEEHGRAKTHMLRTQMGTYKAAGGRGQGGPRGGGRGRGGRGRGRVNAIARGTSVVIDL